LKETDTKKRDVFEVLENVNNLPSAPVILAQVSRLLDREDSNATDLSNLISKDQGLVTKILVIANSPLFGIPRRVSTIDFAIVILGFNQIKNIVISLAMMEAFKSIKGKEFNQKKFWQHSILSAYLSKKIADDLGYYFSGDAFTAGLLHDLGIPLIFKFLNESYIEIYNRAKKSEESFGKYEREILGTTHAEIGRFLIDKWGLPESLAEVTEFHHTPEKSRDDFKEIAYVVHLADYILNFIDIGGFDWDQSYELDEAVFDVLKLSGRDYLDGLIEKYKPLLEEQLNSTFI